MQEPQANPQPTGANGTLKIVSYVSIWRATYGQEGAEKYWKMYENVMKVHLL